MTGKRIFQIVGLLAGIGAMGAAHSASRVASAVTVVGTYLVVMAIYYVGAWIGRRASGKARPPGGAPS